MPYTNVYAKGQITIPKTIREELGIEPGDRVRLATRDGVLEVTKAKGVLEANGIGAPKKRLPWEEVKRIAREEHAEALGRKLRALDKESE